MMVTCRKAGNELSSRLGRRAVHADTRTGNSTYSGSHQKAEHDYPPKQKPREGRRKSTYCRRYTSCSSYYIVNHSSWGFGHEGCLNLEAVLQRMHSLPLTSQGRLSRNANFAQRGPPTYGNCHSIMGSPTTPSILPPLRFDLHKSSFIGTECFLSRKASIQ